MIKTFIITFNYFKKLSTKLKSKAGGFILLGHRLNHFMDETPTTGDVKEERKIDMSGKDIQIHYSPKIKITCTTERPRFHNL